MDDRQHHSDVRAFFEQCAREQPEKYREVCQKYPCLTRSKLRRMRRQEITVGLLGLQMSRVPFAVLDDYGFSFSFDDDNDA